MPTPTQFPLISQDASFKEDATIYADHAFRTLSAPDIRRAIEAAYLAGGDNAFRTGYRVGQTHARQGKRL